MAICRWQGDVSTDPEVAGNWSTAAVPQANDDVVFDGTAEQGCDGGDLTANEVDTITYTEDFEYNTGLVTDVLQFTCDEIVDMRCGGTHYLDIDAGAGATNDININGAATVYLVGLNNISLNINAAGAIVEVGAVALAAEFDTCTVTAGTVTFWQWETAAAGAPNLLIHGGTVKTYDALVDVRQSAGTWTHFEGTCTNLYLPGGTTNYNSNGTITALYLEGGKFDLSHGWRPVTVSATQVRAGSTILDPRGRATWTAAPEFHNCSFPDCTVDFGFHKKYTVAAI